MDRRTAVKNVIVFSAGLSLLPSCLQGKNKSVQSLKNIQVDTDGEEIIAELTNTILPFRESPDMKMISAGQFVLMMVDECFEKEEQERFIRGLQQFDTISKARSGQSFIKSTGLQRSGFLKEIESKKDIPDDVIAFYDATKKLTIQHFTGSHFFLTKIRPYEMVPGRFHGSFPLANSN